MADDTPAPPGPPATGHADVDEALAALADLPQTDLADHPEQLAAAHEALHRALDEANRADR